MTANVKIATGEAQNALLVPAMALQKANGMYQVLVAEHGGSDGAAGGGAGGGRVERRELHADHVRGLNEGDKVVVEMVAAQPPPTSPVASVMFDGGGGPPPGASEPQRTGSSSSGRGADPMKRFLVILVLILLLVSAAVAGAPGTTGIAGHSAVSDEHCRQQQRQRRVATNRHGPAGESERSHHRGGRTECESSGQIWPLKSWRDATSLTAGARGRRQTR